MLSILLRSGLSHIVAVLAEQKQRFSDDSKFQPSIVYLDALRYIVSLTSAEERHNVVDGIVQAFAKPEDRRKVYMIVRMFDDAKAEMTCTTKGWLLVYDLFLKN